MLQLRGPVAPQQFSWYVDLQPDLELKELPDGAVAVVVPAEPDTDIAGMEDPPAPPTVAEQRAALPDTASHLSQDEDELARIQSEHPDEVVAVFRAPWAKGPQGEDIATSLSATGSTITMSVQHVGLQGYPVIAHTQASDRVATDEGTAAESNFDAVEWAETEEDGFDEMAPADPGAGPDPTPAPDDAPAAESGEDYPDESSSAGDVTVGGPGEEDPDAPGADEDGPDATTAGISMAELQQRANAITVGTSEGDVDTEILDPQSQKLGPRPRRPMVYWDIYHLVKQEERGAYDADTGDTAAARSNRCRRHAARKWLAYARAAAGRGIGVMPTFNLRIGKKNKDCDKRQPNPPTVKQYKKSIRLFLQRWNFVKRITAYNEPNLGVTAGQRLPKGAPYPGQAARYWIAANSLCHNKGTVNNHRCAAVPAGDFAGTPGDAAYKHPVCTGKRPNRNCSRTKKIKYRESYRKHLFRRASENKRPLIWAFHNWGDLHRFEVRSAHRRTAPITTHFRTEYAKPAYEYAPGKTPRVWVTEVGAAYRHTCRQINVGESPRRFRNAARRCDSEPPEARDANGNYYRAGDKRTLRYGELRQRNALAFLFRVIARPHANRAPIQRLYYFNAEDNRGADISSPGRSYYTGRCNAPKQCPLLESGLIGSLVDSVADDDQPNAIIRDFGGDPLPQSLKSQTNSIRPAFCVLKGHRTRPVKKTTNCNPDSGKETRK